MLISVIHGKIVQFNLSDIGEGIAEVEVKEWHVKEGDQIAEFDNLCEVQSDKASVTITSRYEGVVKKLYYQINDIAPVGKPLVDIELEGDEEEAPSQSREQERDSASSSDEEISPDSHRKSKALATPAVRRIAKEYNVDLSGVSATGKDGRVLKEDILRHIGHAQPASPSPPKEPLSVQPVHPIAGTGSIEGPRIVLQTGVDKKVPLRGYGRIMLKTMAQANQIPHFGYCDEICMDRLVELRTELKEMATERGIRMSFMPLFIKAASLALHEFPVLNSSLDESLDNITYKAAHNITVAMDTPGGLVVPNIKNCEQKNLWDIASDLMRLHEAGIANKLSQDDLTNGTFTLSNIGSIGGTYAHPVIFPPQVAIGALGKIMTVPRFDRDGDVVPTQLVKVSWSADHRVIDGATMARFSNVWKRYLENPGLMIAEMK